ncbi:MAG: VanW family protein [Acidimicrobiales bacterium]
MSDGKGENKSDSGEGTPSLPDISDIEGATTGPLQQPDAAAWAAPTVDGLEEAATGAASSDEVAAVVADVTEAADPSELLGADDPAEHLDAGEPTQRFEPVQPDPSPDRTSPIAASPPANPPANPTVSIDAQRASTETAPSLAVTTAASMPITASGEHPTTLQQPDPTGDVAGSSNATAGAGPDATKQLSDPLTEPPDVMAGSPASPPKVKRGRKLPKFAFLAILGLIALFVGAWLLDSARTSDEVLRNTTLGSQAIGGLDSDELAAVIDTLDADLERAPLTVMVDGVEIATNAAALGAEIDREALIDEALDAGREGGTLSRPFRWISSFWSEQTIDPTYRVDPARASEGVDGVIGDALENPVEPTLVMGDTSLTLSPGSDGITVDPNEIAEVLPPALVGTRPYTVILTPVATNPALTDEAVEAVIAEASEATTESVIFQVLDQTGEVDSTGIRQWIRLDTEGAEPTWVIDTEAAVTALQPLFPVLGTDEQQARFEVIDGRPEVLPATETVICCDQTSVSNIKTALLAPAPVAEDEDGEAAPLRVVRLEPEVVGADEGVAELESLGIIEEVSTFTTNFPAGQPRVTNIQRIADLTRGVVIRPGENFSLNEFVGRRTIENGFVADGAIANGILEPQVGGGISQFATTFFNATFFAGLEFNEYQSHSLYISRYPRGREATISFPKPDLSVNNSTDYGVLVWTSYTGTSITVTFYSTRHIDVVAGDLLRSDQGACSRYTTPRIRTLPDGTVVEDSVFAVYRPGEGLDCDGNSTRPEDQPNGPTIPTPEPEPEPAPDDDPGTETTTPPATTSTTAPAEDNDS